MDTMFSRTEFLLGIAGMARLQQAHVLLVGAGGVGGAVAEMLVRAGIGRLTVVDADKVQSSNINRQLVALQSTVGQAKVEAWRNRLLDINPDLCLSVVPVFIDENNTAELLHSTDFSFVVDAIDTISPKVFLLKNCVEMGIPVISSMGSGAKTDPAKVRLTDIGKTEYCALAKTIRTRLSKLGIKHGIPCVYSTEVVDKAAVIPAENERYKKSTTGTVSYMPNLFGCWIASYVIQKIAGSDEPQK